MDPEVEAKLAPLLAQAAQQLLQSNQAQAAQAQAQQQAQDPLVQMQMQELQLKQQEQQRKATKDQTDAAIAAQKLQLDKERVSIEASKEGMRVQAQERQANNRLKFDALKLMATPTKQNPPKGS
jgi:Ni/Co efflux regulator RcnB